MGAQTRKYSAFARLVQPPKIAGGSWPTYLVLGHNSFECVTPAGRCQSRVRPISPVYMAAWFCTAKCWSIAQAVAWRNSACNVVSTIIIAEYRPINRALPRQVYEYQYRA